MTLKSTKPSSTSEDVIPQDGQVDEAMPSSANVDVVSTIPKAEESEAALQPSSAEDQTARHAQDASIHSHDDAQVKSENDSPSSVEKVTSSPAKESLKSSRPKKGTKSKGKQNNLKGSSEEHEGDIAHEAEEGQISDESDTNQKDPTNEPDSPTTSNQNSSTATSRDRQGSSSSETQGSQRNGNGRRQRSSSANKELAKLGLQSFGDGGEEELVGPRRSRRAAGASPDPKAKPAKKENEVELDDDYDQVQAQQETDDADNVAPTAIELPASTENPDVSMTSQDYTDVDGADEGVTRCVCGSTDENVGLMIQCETCKCWQHCVCMGMQVEEDCPDVYYCEQCKPELHIPLLRSLGLLPPRSGKKGSGKGGKNSAKELKEAKEAIAILAQANAKRNQAEKTADFQRDRRLSSNSKTDAEYRQSPKSPKRRSTMNSRDSAYGTWEPIPPGLLNEGEVWDAGEALHQQAEERKAQKKRKRGGAEDESELAHDEDIDPTDDAQGGPAEVAKRRRMSAGATDPVNRLEDEMEEDDEEADADAEGQESISLASKDKSKKRKNGQSSGRESSVTADGASNRPRHPNQYTYKNKSVFAGHNGKGGSTSTSNLTSHSPSPSPSKNRAEVARCSGREGAGSRNGTPVPGESNSSGKLLNPGAAWGMPEHLSHLAYLLPIGISRLPNIQSNAGKNGGLSLNQKKGGNATSLNLSTVIPQPPAGSASPQPFQVISAIEATTKVRFPGRRMTMGEMRKRVRNIGEYVTRSQIEAVECEKRMKLLGIVPPYMENGPEPRSLSKDGSGESTVQPGSPIEDRSEETKKADDDEATGHPAPRENDESNEEVWTKLKNESKSLDSSDGPANTDPDEANASPFDKLPMSMKLMEELTRELINFQKKFGIGPGAYGSLGSTCHSSSGGHSATVHS